jgi:hypothetical protein
MKRPPDIAECIPLLEQNTRYLRGQDTRAWIPHLESKGRFSTAGTSPSAILRGASSGGSGEASPCGDPASPGAGSESVHIRSVATCIFSSCSGAADLSKTPSARSPACNGKEPYA